ncbi:MAG: DNA repair protein RecN [Candidatus Aminicenantes bacterium]|nr:DNA repair protein RecN [Candidatus Aminicenantes bacterium]
MIKFLRIRNLATIEDIRMDLSEGLSILTGETGAGKSIIIDGIRLICGEKASPDLVRTGRAEASLEAIFSRPDSGPERADLIRDKTSDDLVLQRSIGGAGTGKAYGDGILVPVKRLKELAGPLVDIYGQNDHVFLLRLDSHLDYLDHFSGTIPLRDDVAAAARELRRLGRLKVEWTERERERSQRLDYLDFQIREIDKAGLRPDEEEELRARRHLLKNAEKISALVEQALDTAYAGDPSLLALLAKLEHALAELSAFDPAFTEMNESLGPLGIVVRELADVLMRYKEKQDLSPEKTEEVEARLSLIENLKRKYGGDIRNIQFYLENIKREHEDLVGIQEKLARVEAEIASAFAVYTAKATALSAVRKKAAAELEKLIEKEIGLLGMKKARFHIQIDPFPLTEPNPDRIRDTGMDDVEFVISPNPGEQLKPLRKIASGGELSRIMLALKAVGKEKDGAKTLIFDEIDAGIGGKTAEFIAQKLKSLARTHQIICITHLPQIASFADHHFRIEKTVAKNRTFTAVKKLSFEERVEEIARLMSGSLVTPAALESAREMLRHHAADARD